jgi:hypothetical protein
VADSLRNLLGLRRALVVDALEWRSGMLRPTAYHYEWVRARAWWAVWRVVPAGPCTVSWPSGVQAGDVGDVVYQWRPIPERRQVS